MPVRPQLRSWKSSKGVAQNVVNSEHYSVLAYPAQESFELGTRKAGACSSRKGPSALHFRAAIEEIPEGERDEETIDAFLDDYCRATRRGPLFSTDVLGIPAISVDFEDCGKWAT